MNALKRIGTACAAVFIFLSAGIPSVHAEEPDFSDTSYWNNLCTGSSDLSEEEEKNCNAYMSYMQSKNQELQQKIAEIDARKQEISANITSYNQQIEGFNAQINGINSMINDLNAQIKAVEEQVEDINHKIEVNEKAIVAKQDEIDSLKEHVKNRMVEQQKTMHFYQFLDVLAGAESFEDFIRLANGINAIYERDDYSLSTLKDRIDELHSMQDELLADQEEVKTMEAELELGRQALASQQTALLSSRYELDVLKQNYSSQLAAAEAEQQDAQNAIAANQNKIGEISDNLNATPKPSANTSSSSDTSDSRTDSGSSTPSGSSEAPAVINSGGNPYYGGWSNCTWGAWQLVHDTLGISLPGWGMAGNWISDAAASGYATGSTPRVNSIAVYSWHVAFVTAVDGDRVYIKEGNYMGHYYERWVPANGLPYTGQTCLGYIYL
ncbi:MAG: CHAP domain-containing protein [Solobacterium sp.]|nr:CHAP domain-containing protein [Solobacterium sp.]